MRVLGLHGLTGLIEVTLPNGRRADVMALSASGAIWIIEIKSSVTDFQVDQKWPEYRDYCDALFFAVATDFPQELLPPDTGLIVADRFGGELIRQAPEHRLAPARRKAVTLHYARVAAARLAIAFDPQALARAAPARIAELPRRLTNAATIRRDSGSTKSTTGNATAHDNPHADIHRRVNSGTSPIARHVDTPDTTLVMMKVRTKGSAIALKRAGSLDIEGRASSRSCRQHRRRADATPSRSGGSDYFGARLARMRCSVLRCMLRRRAVSETLRLHSS